MIVFRVVHHLRRRGVRQMEKHGYVVNAPTCTDLAVRKSEVFLKLGQFLP